MTSSWLFLTSFQECWMPELSYCGSQVNGLSSILWLVVIASLCSIVPSWYLTEYGHFTLAQIIENLKIELWMKACQLPVLNSRKLHDWALNLSSKGPQYTFPVFKFQWRQWKYLCCSLPYLADADTVWLSWQGPRVIVVGPTDSGKSCLVRMLLGWAAREGWKPTYADLDIGQGSITVPGTVSATPVEMPIHPIEGVPLDLPLVYFYGHTTPRLDYSFYTCVSLPYNWVLDILKSGHSQDGQCSAVQCSATSHLCKQIWWKIWMYCHLQALV